VTWQRRRWDSSLSLQLGADLIDTDFFRRTDLHTPEIRVPLDLGTALGVGYSTVREFALSLGPQEGVQLAGRAQARRYLEPPEWAPDRREFWRLTSRARAFRGLDWFGFAPPTLAARIDAGIESQTAGAGFSLGGTGSQELGLPVSSNLLDRSIAYPVRGIPVGARRGNRVISASVEYRFPIALVERGFRLAPLGIDRLTGDLFLDAGTAWCAGRCEIVIPGDPTSPDPLLSLGAEAVLDLRAAYFLGLPIRLGIALPLQEYSPSAYVRLGRSF
jgi:hypothetical protein